MGGCYETYYCGMRYAGYTLPGGVSLLQWKGWVLAAACAGSAKPSDFVLRAMEKHGMVIDR